MQEDVSGTGRKMPAQTKELGLISMDTRSGVLLVRRLDAGIMVSVVRIGLRKRNVEEVPRELVGDGVAVRYCCGKGTIAVAKSLRTFICSLQECDICSFDLA
jgi:hypothetical protein